MERLREPRVAAVVGIALAIVAIVVYLLVSGGDDSSTEPTGGAEAASVEDLQAVADSADFPVFWAGEQSDKQYELTISPEGNIFVRYLDPDTPIGSEDELSLTVGTYPVPDGYGATQSAAKQEGAITDETPDGGLVVTNKSNPNSVYIAYPDTDYQIEVYDPDAKEALKLATSGAIVPIS